MDAIKLTQLAAADQAVRVPAAELVSMILKARSVIDAVKRNTLGADQLVRLDMLIDTLIASSRDAD